MRVAKYAAAASAVAMLGACGGGGSSGTGGGPTPTPTTATLPVTLSASSATVVVPEGQTETFGFTASYTGTSAQPVVANVTVGGTRYALEGAPTPSGNGFAVALKTAAFAPGGRTTSTVTFRLCTSADCSTVYPGSTQTFTVDLDVQLKDWKTFQRDIAHTGYVPVSYDPAKFAKAWEWTDTFENGWIHEPAATRGKIYVTVGRDGGMPYAGTSRLIAFNTADGSRAWARDLGQQFHMSGPSIAQDMIHVTSMEHTSDTNPQWVFDLATGAFRAQMHFSAQWTIFSPPAADGNQVFVAAGMYGNVIYGFDATREISLWQVARPGPSIWGGQSMALDTQYLYFSTGQGIEVYNRASGALVSAIATEVEPSYIGDNEGGPVLGNGMAFTYQGSRRYVGSNRIIATNLATGKVQWISTAEYNTPFALKDSTIFAVRHDARALSAIDANTGQVLWSTLLPSGDFAGNVVVTQNLAFVSTDKQTFAVDLSASDHPVVWTAPTGGRLAITPDNYLLTVGERESRKLTAYKLH